MNSAARTKGTTAGRNNSVYIVDANGNVAGGQSQYLSRKIAEQDLDYWTNKRGQIGWKIVDFAELTAIREAKRGY